MTDDEADRFVALALGYTAEIVRVDLANFIREVRAERTRLRIALVDAVHRLQCTPQHQLVDGIGMSGGGLGYGVHFRAGDGVKYDVYASRAELDAVDAANAAERERVKETLARLDAQAMRSKQEE